MDFKDIPNKWPWPPIITIGAILIGWGTQVVQPLDWLSNVSDVIWPVGPVMIALALTIDVWAFRIFKVANTTIMPKKAASHLVTHGPFAWSRNPIYVGNVVLISGFAIWFGNPWLLVMAAIAWLAIGEYAIKREETHLAATFGDEWNDYTKKVRRWL